MAGDSQTTVTAVLSAVYSGRAGAADKLMELVYDELRQLARRQMVNVPPGVTLQPTALVHEAYLRLLGGDQDVEWASRAHFFNAAARAMRDILVEQARRHASLKRGGDRKRVPFDEDKLITAETRGADLLALDDALRELDDTDPDSARLAKLRYFAGLTIDECALAIGASPATVKRRWRYAMAWLHRRMCDEGSVQEGADEF